MKDPRLAQGMAIKEDNGLEKEADVMGEKALRYGQAGLVVERNLKRTQDDSTRMVQLKRFYRWVPKQHADDAIEKGLVSHGNRIALWVFAMDGDYRPSMGKRGNLLIYYELDDKATRNITERELIDFESEEFRGEAQHDREIITKSNEPGAYGIGKFRQGLTNKHVTSKGYATKKEVAKALGLKEREVGDAYTPRGGWKS